ncbi:hypothetical protein MUG94_11460 [Arthrobacter gengyunqii]|uniref:Uncharacterized protein n=1 Tax=Arthrobacter gengyunqii TaxID=2886940 RepID=A0A9X1M2Q7_9MICC|nr:hypothetical protein [Arthrobacter gengyunqii]MCC3269896.1 hypothetical protein [Arthrobacter gengyunqii]UOY95172.1 hypothetical protein MUG94_11460 [Arthrobacter gengyunqii]
MQGRHRDISKRAEKKYEYASKEEFLASSVLDGLHTIDIGGLPLDILYRHRSAATTLVTFHAAATSQASIPIFSGTRMTEEINANVVFVSDPSLVIDEKIKLGWFAGNRHQPLQSVLPEVIRHIVRDTGAQHLIFFGASGGGFASLYYSSLFPGSLAIGVNPRTIVDRSFPTAISRYAQLCWGLSEQQDISNLLSKTIHSDLRIHTPLPPVNTVAYVQNSQDERYINSSLLPYLDAFEDTSHIHLLMKDWGKGHVPADRKFLIELLTLSTARAPRWIDALEELNFLPSPDAAQVAAIRTELKTRRSQREVVVKRRWSQLKTDPASAPVRLLPLDSIRSLIGNNPIIQSKSEQGLQVRWDPSESRRLYLTTFGGGFSSPPTGAGSDVMNCSGEDLIQVQFATEGTEGTGVKSTPITLFVIQYAGTERRRTDTWRFEVDASQSVHSAFVPILAGADSFRLAFLVHSKTDGAFSLRNLQTRHYR